MTIYDIATYLGVSAATVSLALNGDRRVAAKTRDRILEYADKHGFKRNEQARNFRLRRTNNVALVVHNIDNDFWYGVVKAIEDALGDSFNVILCNTEGDPAKERKIFHNLLQRRVDGIIVQPASPDEQIFEETIRSGIALVSLEETDNALISFVKGNDFKSARRLTEACIMAGHRKIAFLSFDFDCVGLNERIRGFNAATENAGISEECEVFVAEELSFEAVDRIFGDRARDFSLAIGLDDRIACQLLRVLAARRIRVPDDLSVIGWNNSRFLEYLTPTLSSVAIPMPEIGRRAAEIILTTLEHGSAVVKEYVDEQIFLRESFAPFQSNK